MTKRGIKKQAKNLLAGRKTRGIVFRSEDRYPRNDGTIIITERIPVSDRFHRAVWNLAGGWCHWDSPYIIDVVEWE